MKSFLDWIGNCLLWVWVKIWIVICFIGFILFVFLVALIAALIAFFKTFWMYLIANNTKKQVEAQVETNELLKQLIEKDNK